MKPKCGNCGSDQVWEMEHRRLDTGSLMHRQVGCSNCGRRATYSHTRWSSLFHAARNLMYSNNSYPAFTSLSWKPLFYS